MTKLSNINQKLAGDMRGAQGGRHETANTSKCSGMVDGAKLSWLTFFILKNNMTGVLCGLMRQLISTRNP
jgi:hypothetical protein